MFGELKKIKNTWWSAARPLGLTFQEGNLGSASPHLAGSTDGFRVTVRGGENHGLVTEVKGVPLGQWTTLRISYETLVTKAIGAISPDVQAGDEGFDGKFHIRGRERALCAQVVGREDVQAAVSALFDEHHGRNLDLDDAGTLEVDTGRFPRVPEVDDIVKPATAAIALARVLRDLTAPVEASSGEKPGLLLDVGAVGHAGSNVALPGRFVLD